MISHPIPLTNQIIAAALCATVGGTALIALEPDSIAPALKETFSSSVRHPTFIKIPTAIVPALSHRNMPPRRTPMIEMSSAAQLGMGASAMLESGSTDVAGIVALTIGIWPSAFTGTPVTVARIRFAHFHVLSDEILAMVDADNEAAANLGVRFEASVTNTGFDIAIVGTPGQPLPSTTVVKLHYLVITATASQ